MAGRKKVEGRKFHYWKEGRSNLIQAGRKEGKKKEGRKEGRKTYRRKENGINWYSLTKIITEPGFFFSRAIILVGVTAEFLTFKF